MAVKTEIAVIGAGAMGSAVARRLIEHGVVVLTSLTGRSAASRARAEAAGVRHADDDEIVQRSKFILSIVPPGEALGVAEQFVGPLQRNGAAIAFADCNAISPSTVARIARLIEGAGALFVDGSIIGGPPSGDDAGPTFYFAGGDAGALSDLAAWGLRVRMMDGPVGAAKALKLSYAGITKGLTALATSMILAAERAGAGQALHDELAASQASLLGRFARALPDMYPKAYRWVAEMQEISDFISPRFPESRIFDGAAGPNHERAILDAFLQR
jgi:3-hydroxyisobutyrate dehydrogenase-like beta-hydroxyacid dehydrogenase